MISVSAAWLLSIMAAQSAQIADQSCNIHLERCLVAATMRLREEREIRTEPRERNAPAIRTKYSPDLVVFCRSTFFVR